MAAPPNEGASMRTRPRKVMIITAIGMIIMIAAGRGDQRTNEKGKLHEYLESIGSRNKPEMNSNKPCKPESRSDAQSTYMIEIESGTKERREAAMNKKGKSGDLSRKGLWYHDTTIRINSPRA